MVSKAVTERTPEQDDLSRWQGPRERAPSVMREDEPKVARMVGFFGILFLALGAMGLVVFAYGRVSRVGPGLASFCAVLGLACLLFHASRDRDQQVRRLYGAFGFLTLLAAIIFAVVPSQLGPAGTLFLPYSVPCLLLSLLFLLSFAHNETDPLWRDRTLWVLGGVGAALTLTGFVGGNISNNFLLPYGVILLVLGLGYLWAFVGQEGITSDLGYRAGVGMGVLGVLVFLVALGRSALPPLLHAWGMSARPTPFLVPGGLLLMGLGLLYAAMSAGLCSDNRVVVMTRRELAAYFYSPIAYIVLFGLTVMGWILFIIFTGLIVDQSMPGRTPLVEPVIRYYIIDWFPIICVIFVVPTLTMRLLSEEQRTGTLEVLLTAPVEESSIVLSKFLAVLIFFMAVWVPWGLFLVALRVLGGEPFDYRPLLSFFIALAATGAGFVSMGLFFSSLTRNQIAAAILTFVGMLGLTMLFFAKRSMAPESTGFIVLKYVSYIDLWIDSLEGTLSLRHLMFHVSAAILWLFLTVKVLEARRWS